MRLWEINLCKKDGTPIALDKLWAYFALLRGGGKMRTTIAYKKHSAGILYIILTFVGVMLLVSAITEKLLPLGIIGVLLTIISVILSIRFLSLPSDIIVLSEDGSLILPKGVTVSLESVSDVSYRRASAKGIQYRWGSITLLTYYGSYKYGFVADCEDVAKQLTQMVFEAKQKTQQKESR